MDGLILAVDLGRFNSVLCWCDGHTRAPAFRTTPTIPRELRRELLRRRIARVVIEACSPARWVHDLCGGLGLHVGCHAHGFAVGMSCKATCPRKAVGMAPEVCVITALVHDRPGAPAADGVSGAMPTALRGHGSAFP